VVADPNDKRLPEIVRACVAALGRQLLSLKKPGILIKMIAWWTYNGG